MLEPSLPVNETVLVDEPTELLTHPDGTLEWLLDGRRHRADGEPAIIYGNGDRMWFQYGKLHRDHDLPAIEYVYGTKLWFRHGEQHRDNGPAIERSKGDRLWYQNDWLHRLDGPAVMAANGKLEWWVHGRELPDYLGSLLTRLFRPTMSEKRAFGLLRRLENQYTYSDPDLPSTFHAANVKYTRILAANILAQHPDPRAGKAAAFAALAL